MSTTPISREYLFEILNYDQETGIFTWKKKVANCIQIGDVAGYSTAGYRRIPVNKKYMYAQRLAWVMINGEIPKGFEVDHIDGCKDNNKIANLRLATHRENLMNRGATSTSKSGVKGVFYNEKTQKWVAGCGANSAFHYIGTFDLLDDAIAARNNAAKTLHKDFYKASV